MILTLELPWPDDAHIHLRDGKALQRTVTDAAAHLHRMIVMPNLNPPITDGKQAQAYATRIKAHCPSGSLLKPYMTLYATDQLTPEILATCAINPEIPFAGVKWYPRHVTTHAQWGLTHWEALEATWAYMAEHHVPLLVHGEVHDPEVDVFDREAVFIERHLIPLRERFPQLKIVLEHITTLEAVEFVRTAGNNTAASITAHHLWYDRNALFEGGLRPHHYCLPVLKHRRHRKALREIVASGHPRFFMGTDSAPHVQGKKECAVGCAGIYTGYAPISYYATLFEELGILPRLADFIGRWAAEFYGWPRIPLTRRWKREPWQVPERLVFDGHFLIPFLAGQWLNWQPDDPTPFKE